VAGGQDNELFILAVDLLELTDQLEPLLKAVRVALARHHQVLVVCPWPIGIAPPSSDTQDRGTASPAVAKDISVALRQTATAHYHRAFDRVRKAFARFGISVVRVDHRESPRLILSRLEQMRVAGRRWP
jgi:hypothetical protein